MPINSIEEGCQVRKLWVALMQTNILVEFSKHYAIFAKCEITLVKNLTGSYIHTYIHDLFDKAGYR